MENQFFIDSEFLSEKALEKNIVWKRILLFEKITWNIFPEWKKSSQMYVKML